jgi:DNA-binding response OmpR family regulator
MTASSCPKCGYDLIALHALTIGDLKIEHDGAVILWRGKLVVFSQVERLMVLALARAEGAAIKRDVLAEAAGYEGPNADNWVSVYLIRINEKFRYIDPAFDMIENVRGLGLRWKVDAP